MTLDQVATHPEFWALYAASKMGPHSNGHDVQVDETARGALADWLIEAGHPAVAEGVRAALPYNSREFNSSAVQSRDMWDDMVNHGTAKKGQIFFHPRVHGGQPALRMDFIPPNPDHPQMKFGHSAVFHLPMTHESFGDFLGSHPDESLRKEWSKAVERHTGRPVKLARPGEKSVVVNSAQHKKRIEVARKILKEAGLTPSTVVAATHHSPAGARAATVQFVHHADPETVRYAAAWYGLLSGEPGVNVFFPGDGGPHALHIVRTNLPTARLADGLKRAGIVNYTVHDKTAYALNPTNREGAALKLFAEGNNASHSVVRGVNHAVGGGQGAAADAGSRADYRSVVRKYESAGA